MITQLFPGPDWDVEDGVDYPSSDGQPMAETGFHVEAIISLKLALDDLFEDRPDVQIMADQFWYWEKGNNKACCAPDVMVITGVIRHLRRSFRSWNENGIIPAVIFEMASRKTGTNLRDKKLLYERLRVKEYFIFDPEERYLHQAFRGFRLSKGRYREVANPTGSEVVSKELGVRMIAEDMKIRLLDLRTEQKIPTRLERAKMAEQKAASAGQALTEKDAEIARLKAELKAAAKGPQSGTK